MSSFVNLFLAYGAVLLQIVSVVIFLLLVFRQKNKVLDFIKERFVLLGFLATLLPALFSLYYSQIVGFAPCFLCWWQRVFMFPVLFLFGIDLWRRTKNSKLYAMALVVVGMGIAIYHNYSYYFIGGDGPCDASGVSCNQILVSELGGYISIPMLSLTGFFAIFVILLVSILYKNNSNQNNFSNG